MSGYPALTSTTRAQDAAEADGPREDVHCPCCGEYTWWCEADGNCRRCDQCGDIVPADDIRVCRESGETECETCQDDLAEHYIGIRPCGTERRSAR